MKYFFIFQNYPIKERQAEYISIHCANIPVCIVLIQYNCTDTPNKISDLVQKKFPIGLYAQMGGKAGELVLWNNRMATFALVILPMLLVFLSLNKYITKGLTAGALKG